MKIFEKTAKNVQTIEKNKLFKNLTTVEAEYNFLNP
jgi:hypothetical protein